MLEEFVRRMPDWTVTAFDRHPSLEVRGPAHVELAFTPSQREG